MKDTTGLTLIELMVTLSVFAIMTAIGTASFSGIAQSNRYTTQINTLITDLAYARSEAATRNRAVSIVANTGTNWATGWQIVVAGSGAVIRNTDALPSMLTLNGNVNTISYRSDGTQTSGAVSITLCESGKPGNYGKQITINTTGRHTLTEGVACT